MSDLMEAVNKTQKDLSSLSEAIRDYGEKALAAMEKKVGAQPPAEKAGEMVLYYDKVLLMVRRAQSKLIETMTGIRKQTDRKVDLSSEEKWLFFYRYEQYVMALSAEAESKK